MADRIKNRKSVEPHDLCEDSITIAYEFEMLRGTAKLLSEQSEQMPRIMKNALLESFAIHARAIIFFLYGHQKNLQVKQKPDSTVKLGALWPSDVLAYDFDPNWKEHAEHTVTEEMVKAYPEANKMVAHITIERRGVNLGDTPPKSIWNFYRLTEDLQNAFMVFLKVTSSCYFQTEQRSY